MHETYRMLGKEREADLEREAQRFHRAVLARPAHSHERAPAADWRRTVPGLVRSLLAALRRPELGPE
jgi:hypothetical protein